MPWYSLTGRLKRKEVSKKWLDLSKFKFLGHFTTSETIIFKISERSGCYWISLSTKFERFYYRFLWDKNRTSEEFLIMNTASVKIISLSQRPPFWSLLNCIRQKWAWKESDELHLQKGVSIFLKFQLRRQFLWKNGTKI